MSTALRVALIVGGLTVLVVIVLVWIGASLRRQRRALLVAELGLALCACDQRVLAEYAPHVKCSSRTTSKRHGGSTSCSSR